MRNLVLGDAVGHLVKFGLDYTETIFQAGAMRGGALLLLDLDGVGILIVRVASHVHAHVVEQVFYLCLGVHFGCGLGAWYLIGGFGTWLDFCLCK